MDRGEDYKILILTLIACMSAITLQILEPATDVHCEDSKKDDVAVSAAPEAASLASTSASYRASGQGHAEQCWTLPLSNFPLLSEWTILTMDITQDDLRAIGLRWKYG